MTKARDELASVTTFTVGMVLRELDSALSCRAQEVAEHIEEAKRQLNVLMDLGDKAAKEIKT